MSEFSKNNLKKFINNTNNINTSITTNIKNIIIKQIFFFNSKIQDLLLIELINILIKKNNINNINNLNILFNIFKKIYEVRDIKYLFKKIPT